MIWRLSIRPAGDREAAVARIVQRASSDPAVVTISHNKSNNRLYFCDSPQEAVEERERYRKYNVVSESLCSLRITEKGMMADLTGEEDSHRRLADFLEWIFKTFAPCRVYDGETGYDLSAVAEANPTALLGLDASQDSRPAE